jgi:hypothetical protein
MLISETHFTTKSSIRIPNYSTYDTQHLDGTAHGGTAIIIIIIIIIKNNLKHHLHGHYNREHLQATSVTIDDWIAPLRIAAVYWPQSMSSKPMSF